MMRLTSKFSISFVIAFWSILFVSQSSGQEISLITSPDVSFSNEPHFEFDPSSGTFCFKGPTDDATCSACDPYGFCKWVFDFPETSPVVLQYHFDPLNGAISQMTANGSEVLVFHETNENFYSFCLAADSSSCADFLCDQETGKCVIVPPSLLEEFTPSPLTNDLPSPPSRLLVKFREAFAEELFDRLTEGLTLKPPCEDPAFQTLCQFPIREIRPVYQGLIRQMKSLPAETGLLSQREQTVNQKICRRFPVRCRRGEGQIPELSRTYLLEIDVSSNPSTEGIAEALNQHPELVEYAEPDGIYTIDSHIDPTDPTFPNDASWSHSGQCARGLDDLWNLHQIGAEFAWLVEPGAEGITVAVIDTGIDFTHFDLTNNLWENPGEIPLNRYDDDENGYIDDPVGWDFALESNFPFDSEGHGTAVAGIIAAEGHNEAGMIGLAFHTKIMAVKTVGPDGRGDLTDYVEGIRYAVHEGADVINFSASGGTRGWSTFEEAVNYARSLGVVFVSTAGNSDSNASGNNPGYFPGYFYRFPCNFPAVICVAATDPGDRRAYFSNFGGRVDLSAPGQSILSTGADLAPGSPPIACVDGTSFSAPLVSASAALILAHEPDFSVEQVRQALRKSATPVGATDPFFGYGLINAFRAVTSDDWGATPGIAKISYPFEDEGPPAWTWTSEDGYGGYALPCLIPIPELLEVEDPPDPHYDRGCEPTIEITGFAGGPNFRRYSLELGPPDGEGPWTILGEGDAPVSDGVLGTLERARLQEGPFNQILRLTVWDNSGFRKFEDRVTLNPDREEPSVVFARPVDGATISGRMALRLRASDNDNVYAVRLFEVREEGLISIGKATRFFGQWFYIFDSRLFPNGHRRIRALAADTKNNLGFDDVTFTIRNE